VNSERHVRNLLSLHAPPSPRGFALVAKFNLDSELQFRRVSRAVNSVKNQVAECVEPVNSL